MLESMEQWRKQKAMEMEEQERLAAAAAAEAEAKAKVKIEQADDEKASTTKRKRRRRTGVSWSTKTTKRKKPTTTTDAGDSPPVVTVIDLDLNDDETAQVMDAGVVAASSPLGLDLSQDEISACLAAEENDIAPQPSPPAPAVFPLPLSESQEAAEAVCELATSAREEEEMKRVEAEAEAMLALATTTTTATTATEKGEKAILKEPKSKPRLFTSLVLQDEVECDDGEDWYAARPHVGSEAENGKEEEVEEDSNSVGLRMQLYGEDEPYVVNPHERGNISRFVNVHPSLHSGVTDSV
jgi:hypothetical protein